MKAYLGTDNDVCTFETSLLIPLQYELLGIILTDDPHRDELLEAALDLCADLTMAVARGECGAVFDQLAKNACLARHAAAELGEGARLSS